MEQNEPLLPAPQHEDLIEATNPANPATQQEQTEVNPLTGTSTDMLKTTLANHERRIADIGESTDPEDVSDRNFAQGKAAAIRTELENRGELTTAS